MTADTAPTKPLPKRALIVDDHPEMAAMLARTISQACPWMEVLASCSGKEALAQLEDRSLDILITDMMMPEMNGIDLIEELERRPAGGPVYVVLLTAYDISAYQERLESLHVNKVILKPFRPEMFVQIILSAMNEIDRAKTNQPCAEAASEEDCPSCP